jgi:hypothetical protein
MRCMRCRGVSRDCSPPLGKALLIVVPHVPKSVGILVRRAPMNEPDFFFGYFAELVSVDLQPKWYNHLKVQCFAWPVATACRLSDLPTTLEMYVLLAGLMEDWKVQPFVWLGHSLLTLCDCKKLPDQAGTTSRTFVIDVRGGLIVPYYQIATSGTGSLQEPSQKGRSNVQAFAKRIGALLLNVPLSAVHSKWFGESEKQIAAIFSLSKKLHTEGFTTVVFVDEVEGLLGELQGTAATIDSRPRSEFIQLWDGLEATRGIIVVAATNRPDRLNDAIWRRFSRQIEVCFATAFQAALAVAFSY